MVLRVVFADFRLAIPVQTFASSCVHTRRPGADHVHPEGVRGRSRTGHGTVRFPAGHVVQVSCVQDFGGCMRRLPVQRLSV